MEPASKSPEPTDRELVRRAQAGDEAAFRLLHDRHAARVRARVRRRLAPALRRRVAESDVVQDAFATAFRGIGEFRAETEDGFAHWLAKIADHMVNDTQRRHFDADKRAVAREVSRDRRPETGRFPAQDRSPSAHAVAREIDDRLAAAIARLPDDYRTVLRLVHDEGLTLAEAGGRMQRSAEAVRKLYGRAVGKLAEDVK